MFDDSKKNLEWMEDQLLAQENGPENQEEDDEWLEEELRFAHLLMEKNLNAGGSLADLQGGHEEGEALLAIELPKEPPKPEKGIGGLVAVACLEVVGIIGVGLWWVLCLL